MEAVVRDGESPFCSGGHAVRWLESDLVGNLVCGWCLLYWRTG